MLKVIQADRLLPCPFCGSDQVSASYCTNPDNVISGRFVECEDCAACGPVHPPERRAIKAWNRRLDSTAELLEALEGILHWRKPHADELTVTDGSRASIAKARAAIRKARATPQTAGSDHG